MDPHDTTRLNLSPNLQSWYFFPIFALLAASFTVWPWNSNQTIDYAVESINQYYPDKSLQRIESLITLMPNNLILSLKLNEPATPDYHITTNKENSISARNKRQNLDILFSNKGLKISHSLAEFISIEFESYGYGDDRVMVKPVSPIVQGDKIYYLRDARIIEWYVNSENGLEQVFTLFSSPHREHNDNTPLTLTLNISGTNELAIVDNKLEILSSSGNTVYLKNLYVFDAEGKTLKSNFLLTDKVQIEIDTSNAIFPITVDPLFSKENKLTSGDTQIYDLYGVSVDINGDTAIIGARFADHSGLSNPGAAYVFTRQSNNDWSLQQKLIAVNPAPFDTAWFGDQVAVSGDTAMVSSPFSNAAPGGAIGDVIYIFERSNNSWTQTDIINDLVNFGNANDTLALVGDFAVFGITAGTGVAHIYQRTQTGWPRLATLSASDGVTGDAFGSAVAMSGDTIIIGARYADSGAALIDTGAVYVFVKPTAGWSDMTETRKLIADDAGADDHFGEYIDYDGTTIAIGAPNDTNTGGSQSGAVYFFIGSGANWAEQDKVMASDAANEAFVHFGSSVAINGSNAIAGAPLVRGPGGQAFAGAFYHFELVGQNWIEKKKSFVSNASSLAKFGGAAAISGNRVIVGGASDDNGEIGRAYIFDTGIDLSIVKLDDSIQGFVAPNLPFNYQFIVTNNDPILGADSVIVSDTLPGGVNFDSSPECILQTGKTFDCNLGSIPAGSTSSASIKVTASSAATVINTASVTAAQQDHVIGNNTDSIITIVNTQPTAIEQSVILLRDTSLNITLTSTDPDLDPITYAVLDSVTNGPINGNLTGTAPNMLYTPSTGYIGTDSFKFVANDGKQNSAAATIDITIVRPNFPPSTVNDSYIVTAGETLIVDAVNGLLSNDTDPDDGDSLSVSPSPETPPQFASSLTLNVDGSFTYIHDGSSSASDSFNYTVSDLGGLTAIGSVSIAIVTGPANNPPIARNQILNTPQDQNITAPFDASDVDGDELTYTITLNPTKGTATITQDNSIQYNPDIGEFGNDAFSYKVNDGTIDSNVATVYININATGNDVPARPRLVSPDSGSTIAGTEATFIWEKSIDINNDPLEYQILYCENAGFDTCNPQVVSINTTIVSVGGSAAGLFLFGFIGTRRKYKAIHYLTLTIVLSVLYACGDAVDRASAPKEPSQNTSSQISYTVSNLNPATVYFWKISVDDGKGGSTESNVRSFSTE